MDLNLSGFLIGCVGTVVTLLVYKQMVVTSTQCIAVGFLVLLFAPSSRKDSSPSESLVRLSHEPRRHHRPFVSASCLYFCLLASSVPELRLCSSGSWKNTVTFM